MENNIKQLVLSGVLGDGSIIETGAVSYSCIHKEYLNFKRNLYKSGCGEVKHSINTGYKKGSDIYTLKLFANDYGKKVFKEGLGSNLKDLDELGLAMWLYDDGSLHKDNHFFNINTHSFEKEFQEDVLIPLLNTFNIFPRVMKETKKDGRVFNYLYVAKHKGVYDIHRVLKEYPLNCYKYKLLPEDDYNRWRLLNNHFGGKLINSKTLSPYIHYKGDIENYLKSFHISDVGIVSPNKKNKMEVSDKCIKLIKNHY